MIIRVFITTNKIRSSQSFTEAVVSFFEIVWITIEINSSEAFRAFLTKTLVTPFQFTYTHSAIATATDEMFFFSLV